MPEKQIDDSDIHKNCPLFDKNPNEVERWIVSVLEEHLRDRDYTSSEIDELSGILKDVVESAIMKHQIGCPLKNNVGQISDDIIRIQAQQDGEKKAEKRRNRTLGLTTKHIQIIGGIIVTLFAVLGFIFGVWAKFSPKPKQPYGGQQNEAKKIPTSPGNARSGN